MSLDDAYYYHRGYKIWHLAVENHKPQHGDLELRISDKVLSIQGRSTLITGYGKKEPTKVKGKYPMSKVRPYVSKEFYPGFK